MMKEPEQYLKEVGEEGQRFYSKEEVVSVIRAVQADHQQEIRDLMVRVIEFNQEQINRINEIEKKLLEMKMLKDGPWMPSSPGDTKYQ